MGRETGLCSVQARCGAAAAADQLAAWHFPQGRALGASVPVCIPCAWDRGWLYLRPPRNSRPGGAALAQTPWPLSPVAEFYWLSPSLSFVNQNTADQRGRVTFPKSHSLLVLEAD